MAFCTLCGVEIPDGANVCPSCGATVTVQEEDLTNSVQPEANSGDYDVVKDASDHKFHAICSYFGLLFLVPLLAAKDSKFARFHANQGIILFIAEVIGSIIANIPYVAFLSGIISIVVFVFAIMGIVSAAKGEMKELPLIGNIKILK